MAKQTKKPLTQQQKDFVLKFITKQKPKEAQKQEEKLSGEYQEFLRRREKVMAEIYKFPAGHPKRQELEAEVSGVEDLKEKDGKANFKQAYDKLDKVKERARKAGKGLAPLSPDKIDKEVQMLARMGQNLTTAVDELFAHARTLCDEVRKHPKTSSFATLNEKLDYRDAFQAVEDDLRTRFAALVGDRDAVVKSLNALQPGKKEEEIRKEIALVESGAPGSTTAVAGRLDQALAAFKYQGRPMNAALVTAGLVQSEAALDQLLAEWKDLGGQERDAQPLPEKFRKLEERDRRRLNMAKTLLERDAQWDEHQLGKTREGPKDVDPPYRWEMCPEFESLSDAMPGSDAEVTPNKVRECRDAARKLVKDALTARKNDPDFVFDLSIQTAPTLVAMLESQMGLEGAYKPDDAVLQELDRLGKAGPAAKNTAYFKALKAHAADKAAFRKSRDAEDYKKKTLKLIEEIGQRVEVLKGDTKNATMIADMKKLAGVLKADLAGLPEKQLQLAKEMADEMAKTVAQECPNTTSQQTRRFDIPRPQGGTEEFNAPETMTVNGEPYTVKDCLGAGAFGVAFSYQNAEGKTIVVKSFKATDEEQQSAITQELKMHRHLMGGDDGDGKGNVLRLDGVVRSPDGGIHMILEHADGGGLDRLGDSLRVLGNGGLLSQEAQNAVQRHLILQAVQGLKYMQGRNMTHHDIKADNYFLTSDGTVKLADFGSSQASDNPEGEVSGEKAQGAVAFAAPEVYDSAPLVTGKADTYTLGVLITKLTSPTDANERLKAVSVGQVDYSTGKNVTALDRLVNAMMDPDPSKRPRLESVEYSAYLTDGGGHDPALVQEVIKASIAYSLKAGKEVGEIQDGINSLQGGILAGETWAEAATDDALAASLQGGDAAGEVRKALTASTNDLAEAVKRMERGDDNLRTIQTNLAPALKAARDAEKLCRLGNVTDAALLQQVRDQLAAAQLQFNKLMTALRDAVAAEQKKIDAVNQRSDVALLLEDLKKANDALLRGPDETKTTPQDQGLTPQEAIDRRKEKLQALMEKYQLPKPYEDGLKAVDAAAKAGLFDRAGRMLEELEKGARKVDSVKGFTARTQGLVKRLREAVLGQADQKDYTKRLNDAVVLAKNQEYDKAHEMLNGVERFLRDLEVKDELRRRAPGQDAGAQSVGRGPTT